MSLTAEAVLQYIRANGPSVPNQIRRALGEQDNMIVGAVLSELVSKRLLAVSDLNLGTSKFYYEPGKPESLEPVARYLGEKDLRAYELLSAQQVLRHAELTPLMRVAVASIKDYSRPVRYKVGEDEELFWRYYLLPEPEAVQRIAERWFGARSEPAPAPPTRETPAAPAATHTQQPAQPPVRKPSPK